MANRARLVAQRGGYRGAATRLITKISQIVDDVDTARSYKIHELERKLGDLKDRLDIILDLDNQIIAETDPVEIENELESADLSNTVIRDARDAAEFVIYQYKEIETAAAVPPVPAPTANTGTRGGSNRPKINLPRFNGEILMWQSFWQAFDAEINSDDSTPNINKFNYLIGQLEQNVLNTVAGLTPSNANYPTLVNLLQERYGSEPKIIAAYMRALYGLPKPENNLTNLRNFYDSLESYVRGLEALGKAPDSYGDLLVCILLDKLPADLRKNLARQHDQDEWTLDQLRKSLRGEIRVLEAGQIVNTGPKFKTGPFQASALFNGVSGSNKINCRFCHESHYATQCTKYSTLESRLNLALQKQWCMNCLIPGHRKADCKSKKRCFVCKMKHHSSLHDNKAGASTSESPAVTTVSLSVDSLNNLPATNLSTNVVSSSPFVFLKTAVVTVRSKRGKVSANVLFDEGSQRTFIKKSLADRLELRPKEKEYLSLNGFAGASSQPTFYSVTELSILSQDDYPIRVRAVIVDHVVNALDDKHRKQLVSLPYLQGLNLAHLPTGNDNFEIEILVGADLYWNFIGDSEPIRGLGPTAVSSRVGYLVSGPLSGIQRSDHQSFSLNVTSIEPDLSILWSLEAMGIFPHTEGASEATNYAKECIVYKQGSYIARFPWKIDHPELPTNFRMVAKMTQATIKRLARETKLFKLFGNLIQQQLDSGFIEIVPQSELSRRGHYIPYQIVLKESSTTPFRIVYNCSCRGWNGVSLNDCVETGAALQNDQIGITLRFRLFFIGIVSDVEKAFHHIKLDEADRDFVRWFWLKDPSDPNSDLIVLRFKVVPFGAKSSPFILNSVVIHHLCQESSSVAKDMQRNIFVDNIISGCDTREEAINYYNQANEIMGRANLPLQSWGFSENSIENQFQHDGRIEKSIWSKILGLQWNRVEDTLSVQQIDLAKFCSESTTMRDVLRGNASFYDPLGYYSPLSTKGKIFLQDLHIEKSKLDQPLSKENLARWKEITSSITEAVGLRLMTLNRSYFGNCASVHELHVFCDASRRAYGAVAYFRHNDKTSFVMSKSRVAPLKDVNKEGERELSIPESELMAAYIGTLLADSIAIALEPAGVNLKIFLWGDSQVVHFWISKTEGHPRQFITNRVKKIREFNHQRAATWRYVTTDQNPADLLSRGVSLKDFKNSVLWKNGPVWLPNRNEWPTWSVSSFKSPQSTLQLAAIVDTDKSNQFSSPLSIINIEKFSWSSLLRVTARVIRLLNNFKLRDPTRTSWNRNPLSVAELQYAEKMWIRETQKQLLESEQLYLNSKTPRWRPSLVSQLDLFVDSDGIMRCGGRLANAQVRQSAKYPILIPKNSTLSKQIIMSMHERTFHLGIDATIAQIRQYYWIPSIRQQVKAVCRNCVRCRRDSGPAYQSPDPAPLPAIRVQETYPFAVTGLDYTGAIPIRTGESEANSSAYILLFTCGVTRAIHLEVVNSMTTLSFIDAFRRFTGHHPLPRVIYSDNATTFINAAGVLSKLFNDPMLQQFLTNRRVQWKFIPKRAPWYGGFWERLIGITKTSLRKMVGRSKLSLDELRTIVAEIEAVLNDRPLTHVYSSVNEIEPLTPSHLLYGQRLTILPSDSVAEEEINDPSYGVKPSVFQKHFVRRQNILQSFWRRWRDEYLPSLREHHQSTKGKNVEVIKVGDVVQVHSENRRMEWKLAVVEGLIRSEDGQVRAANIRTAQGKTNRPICKLYPIEVIDNQEDAPKAVEIETEEAPRSRPTRRAALKAAKQIKDISHLEGIEEEQP